MRSFRKSTLDKYTKVQALVASGLSQGEACKQAKISEKTVQAMKKKQPKKAVKLKSKVKVYDLPEPMQAPTKLYMVVGDAPSLAEFARGLQ